MITTKNCKQAIVDWVKQHSGEISSKYLSQYRIVVNELNAQTQSEWKLLYKEKDGNNTVRHFDCSSYGDELKADVEDDGNAIVDVYVSVS